MSQKNKRKNKQNQNKQNKQNKQNRQNRPNKQNNQNKLNKQSKQNKQNKQKQKNKQNRQNNQSNQNNQNNQNKQNNQKQKNKQRQNNNSLTPLNSITKKSFILNKQLTVSKETYPDNSKLQYSYLLSFLETTFNNVADYEEFSQDFNKLILFPCNYLKTKSLSDLVRFVQQFTVIENFNHLLDLFDNSINISEIDDASYYGKMVMMKAILIATPEIIIEERFKELIKSYLKNYPKNYFDNYIWFVAQIIYQNPVYSLKIWFDEFYPILLDKNCQEKKAIQILEFLESIFFTKKNFNILKNSPDAFIEFQAFKDYFILFGSLVESFGSIPFKWTFEQNENDTETIKEQLKKQDQTQEGKVKGRGKRKGKTQGKGKGNEDEREKEKEKEIEVEIQKVKIKLNQENFDSKRNSTRKILKKKKLLWKNYSAKVLQKMEKTFTLIESLSLFFDENKTLKCYFPCILSFACSENHFIRNHSIGYLLQSLQLDEECFKKWELIYPKYIGQSNNVMIFLLQNWNKYKTTINNNKLFSLLKLFIKTNNDLNNGKFDSKKYLETKKVQDNDLIFFTSDEIDEIDKFDVNLSLTTFNELKDKVSYLKDNKKKKIFNFLFFILFVVFSCVFYILWENDIRDFDAAKNYWEQNTLEEIIMKNLN
ncbi:transmembrane protein [Anaeramoeba flamelloides]|uniref:Transmembrane protein n=1 Tax=Anaeramoeba flamelloides TaxID=1746091 RepID=A0ABQ8YHN2_9EUKA|nr:transmembrane protein [Anaeramoeba flamelloides]